jgi:hypothetical protein
MPIHTNTTFAIHFNIIFPSVPWISNQWPAVRVLNVHFFRKQYAETIPNLFDLITLKISEEYK